MTAPARPSSDDDRLYQGLIVGLAAVVVLVVTFGISAGVVAWLLYIAAAFTWLLKTYRRDVRALAERRAAAPTKEGLAGRHPRGL